ncbi:MAG: glycosyltransferase family 2 protein [Crenarchaeota archaeon]|nr:glycosyltransferase family 2 protein [Thermoproteota archaeon]
MAIIIDNIILTTALLILTLGKKIPLEKADNSTVLSNGKNGDLVSVIIPARYEIYETIYQTVRSVLSQTYVPKKVYIVVEEDDSSTLENALKVSKVFENVEVIINRGRRSKAGAINYVVNNHVDTKYVLIIDVGDLLGHSRCIESLVKIAEKGYDVVISAMKGCRESRLWELFLSCEVYKWTTISLRVIRRRFGFCPLPGTGILIRADLIRRHGFPETLAEDAAAGLFLRNSAITLDSILVYNIPPSLRAHLKQRARWIAGFLQSAKLAKGKEKLVYILPFVVAFLTPISIFLMPIMYILHPYSFPWLIVDFVAFMTTIVYVSYQAIKYRNLKLLLLPLIWWPLIGLSSYLAVYYLVKRKWYFSPKQALVRHIETMLQTSSLLRTFDEEARQDSSDRKPLLRSVQRLLRLSSRLLHIPRYVL